MAVLTTLSITTTTGIITIRELIIVAIAMIQVVLTLAEAIQVAGTPAEETRAAEIRVVAIIKSQTKPSRNVF